MTSREKDLLAEAALIALEHVSKKRPGIVTTWATDKNGERVRVIICTPQALANLSVDGGETKRKA